jgi:hypothetical protein
MILYLHPRADAHVRVHEDTLADVTLLADARMPTYMRLPPDAGSGAYFCSGLYLGSWVNEIRRIRHHTHS